MRASWAVASNDEHAYSISCRLWSKLDGNFALSVVQERDVEHIPRKLARTFVCLDTYRTAGRVADDQRFRLDVSDRHLAEIEGRGAERELCRRWGRRRRRTFGDRVGVPNNSTIGKPSFSDDEVDAVPSGGGLLRAAAEPIDVWSVDLGRRRAAALDRHRAMNAEIDGLCCARSGRYRLTCCGAEDPVWRSNPGALLSWDCGANDVGLRERSCRKTGRLKA